MRAAIYTRISTDKTGEALGVKRQEAECRELCKRLKWTVAAVYTDNDISAYRRKPRPGYAALLDAVKSGEVRAVVAWHPDRLHRRPIELEEFIAVIEATGTKVATVVAGHYDLTTASGRMTARVVGAVARHESEQKSERIRAKQREIAKAGGIAGAGGGRPFGYDDDRRTIRVDEARLIREAATRILAGATIRGLCNDWNRRGVPTVTGKPWHPGTLRNLLTSGRIAGLRYHHGVRTAPAVWPGIIDVDTHLRLRAILLDPARRLNIRSRRYLLTGGLAVCGICDAALVARPRQDKRPCYVCATGAGFHGCGKIRSLAEPLDDDILDRFAQRLIAGKLTQPDEPVRDVSLEVLACEAQLEQLAEDAGNGLISRAEWFTARDTVIERLNRLRGTTAADVGRQRLVDLAAQPDPLAALLNMSVDQQRAHLQDGIERITVGPAVKGRNFYDGDRVHVEWR